MASHMSKNEIEAEEIKEIIKNAGKNRVIIFLNCNIESITLNNFENDFREGEHKHFYNSKE